MKNKYRTILLYTLSIIIVFIVLMLTLLIEKGFAFQINYPTDIFRIVIDYIILGIIVFYILKGLIITDKSTIGGKIIIIGIMNIIIYAIMFFTNPNTRIDNFFNNIAFNYFIGYFIFSVSASFIGTSIFYEYKTRVNDITYQSYIIWRYVIQSIIAIQFLYYLFTVFANKFFTNIIFYDHLANYILVGFFTIIFIITFYYIEKRKNKLEKEIKIESTKAETATANFETLKNQLDPHFLFNSLNVLTGLIEENPDKAIDFTTSLSKIYRYLLEQKDKEVVPLSEEINFAKTYINLLKLRFENSINFELDVNHLPENEFIVPLALQILLENTIKHNIVSESKPLKIRIYKEDQHLVVENSLQLKTSVKDSTGVGLNNIINRYQLISNREVKISNENNLFKVELPIIKK